MLNYHFYSLSRHQSPARNIHRKAETTVGNAVKADKCRNGKIVSEI